MITLAFIVGITLGLFGGLAYQHTKQHNHTTHTPSRREHTRTINVHAITHEDNPHDSTGAIKILRERERD